MHHAHVELLCQRSLHCGALFAERGVGARATAQHGHEQTRRRLLKALHVAQQFIHPHGDLVTKRRGHRVLAMGARRHRHIGAAFGEIGHGFKRVMHQTEELLMGLPQHDQIAGLRDVLCSRAPMHPAAMRFTHDAR